jgi:hypothetical protein
VVWSRSGKTIGVDIMYPSPWRFSQTGLDADQAGRLATFLACGPQGDSGIQLRDPEIEGASVEAVWNPSGAHLTITLSPATPWDGALPWVRLTPDDVVKLARFLAAGSPGVLA